MNTPHDPQHLEQLVDRVLRDQPLRKAPASLATRVMTELAHRSSLPWWRKSFGHWPAAARIVFIAALLGVMAITLSLVSIATQTSLGTSAIAQATAPLGWLTNVLAISTFLQHLLTAIAQAVPPTYLYGATAFIIALYLLVFSVSAAAYRTLNFSR